ncbi:hypothetical protein NHX12_014968 [Muraenolepis orangiensis]|uniref:Uncharacterized protein n=1 Tax=Muraenolepis orangiensis TaxID=630683 RepID=A0A9Q0I4D5_9TELE|nr:hypothetical protein NHX12_014968 [Muraenolepis orangiensis]
MSSSSSTAQGLLSSVFSFSSPLGAKASAKRRLRQTKSLDPAIIRNCDTGNTGPATDDDLPSTLWGRGAATADAAAADAAAAGAHKTRAAPHKTLSLRAPVSPSLSTPSIPSEVSPSSHSHFHFDYGGGGEADVVGGGTTTTPPRGGGAKRNTAGDLPYFARSAGGGASLSGSTSALFSPRRWLQQRKTQQGGDASSSRAYVLWRFEVFHAATVTVREPAVDDGGSPLLG